MYMNRHETIEMLKTSYAMELETVVNYMANSINLDGVRAEQVKRSLQRISTRRSSTHS